MTVTTIANGNAETSNARLEPLLKIEEVARILGRTHWTIRHDIKAGKLRGVRLGRRIMIEQSEVRRLIEEGRK
jgi:excisionase family DNA binding protein